MAHRYMSLSSVKKVEPEMKRLKVSEVARSPRGFLTQYKRVGGKSSKLNDYWRNRREGFIARHLVQYNKNKTPRRKLALQAWAYNPK